MLEIYFHQKNQNSENFRKNENSVVPPLIHFVTLTLEGAYL